MEAWNHIINTALLGTDKKQLNIVDLPVDLAPVYEQILAAPLLDKEEQFLQLAAVSFNYRQCGTSALINETLQVPEAPQEELPYCKPEAQRVLKDIMEEQSYSLLEFWLEHCQAKKQIVTPEIIPALFDIAAGHKKLREAIAINTGKRGQWLSGFNKDWDFYSPASDEEIWQNGSTEQRAKLLGQLRHTDPAKALEWLQQTWAAENLTTKTELLKKLETNISASDLEWIESLQTEKGQKLKELVIGLLKRIPGSSISNSYWEVVSKSIYLKKEKTLLGILSKTALHVSLAGVDEAIFKTGIEKLSSKKEISDDDFILYQLIQFIPPHYWETHFSSTPEQVINYFQKEKSTQVFLPALASASWHFNNSQWAAALLESDQSFPGLMQLLPENEQDKYSLTLIQKDADAVIGVARERKTEWSTGLAKAIIHHSSKQPYQYTRNFYSDCIRLIPVAIIDELDFYKPADAYNENYWNNIKNHLYKLLSLKQQTIQIFKS